MQPDLEFNDVSHSLSPRKVARTKKNIHPCRYSNRAMLGAPFPADPHYDAKA